VSDKPTSDVVLIVVVVQAKRYLFMEHMFLSLCLLCQLYQKNWSHYFHIK